MKTPIKIWTKSALLACTLTAAIAIPTWSDTLVLRNGTSYSGTLTGVNGNWIIFKDQRGIQRHYMVRDVDSVQFGDAPDQSRGGSRSTIRPASTTVTTAEIIIIKAAATATIKTAETTTTAATTIRDAWSAW